MVDVELYGGKRGLLVHVQSRVLYALGGYRTPGDTDWASVRRLAFVCKGNICRSPYASARARLLGMQAVSFGLDAADGAPADPIAVRNARLRGVDLSTHRSQRMESCHIGHDDLVIAFEPSQLAEVRRRSASRVPVGLLGVWARPVHPHLQDPYGQSDRYFQHCFSLIDESLIELVGHLVRHRVPEPKDHRDGTLA